jgi:electron transport complex protein RnfB
MAVVEIDLHACINCGWCSRVCPTGAIKYFSTGHRTHVVQADDCIDCGICLPVCPVECISPVPEYVVAPDLLEQARGKAKNFAAQQRQQKLTRDGVVADTLARLNERSGNRA